MRVAALISAALALSVAVASTPAVAFTPAAAATPAAGLPSPPVPSVTLIASPRTVAGGRRVTLSGTATGVPAGTAVRLYASPYPYPVATLAGSTVTAADGSYTFTVRPDRNTRYRAMAVGTAAEALVQVSVIGRAIVKAHAASLGRALVTIVVFHPRDLKHWDGATVQWSFVSGRGGAVTEAALTRARRLSPYVVVLRAEVPLPAGPYAFRRASTRRAPARCWPRTRRRIAPVSATAAAGRCRSAFRARQRSLAPRATSAAGLAARRSPSSTARAGCSASTCTGPSRRRASSRRCCSSATCGSSMPAANTRSIPPATRSCTR